uniref:Uncharacterized protein n=1 Tax=Avena sativa TaxID=4498 RepID=A0ACD5TBK5_AVESA
MADGEGGRGEGRGSSECLPMDDLVEAMLRNSQALAEALAADRARREAADRIQRESWEAALKEKDAEIDRLRAEAAEANKKLQADASRKVRWEAAYELLLGANQKLAELRDADMEDSRNCAETPNSKLTQVESCTKLSQNTVDHTASDFRKLKHDYETLSSKKDKEVSALLSENDSLRSQLDIMQRDNAELLKNKEVEAAQALKLQKSVDELKVLAKKKDDEIARLQAEAVGAKKEHDKDMSALLSEKDSVHNQLSIMQWDYTELLKSKKVLSQKKDHEIVILRAEAVGAKKKVQKMHSLVKEKDDEIQRLKGQHAESVQKQYKDISVTHKRSRSGDPAVTVRDKPEYNGTRQTVEEVYISETRTVENDEQDESTHKRRRASSMSNDDEKSGSDGDDDEQIGSEEGGDKQPGSDEDGDKETGNDEDGGEQSGSEEDGDKQTGSDDDEQSGSGEDGDGDGDDNDDQSGSDEEITHFRFQKPLRNPKRKRRACFLPFLYKNRRKRDVMTWWGWSAPAPLRSKKLEISKGRRFFRDTGNWKEYVEAVNDSLVDQPDKHKEFVWFLRNFEDWRVRDVARIMKIILDGQPKLLRQFNRFLPKNCQIYVKEEEEKRQPAVEQQRQRGVPPPPGQLPSESPSASAAASLIKLKEVEQQLKWEGVRLSC